MLLFALVREHINIFILLSTLPTLGDLDEGYFRNAWCALNLIFTFLLVCTIIFCNELQQVRSLLKDLENHN
jgi:hypothetical protein